MELLGGGFKWIILEISMNHSEKFIWLTIFVIETIFIVFTRVILSYYWSYSMEAELIRTLFRLIAVFIYWHLLSDFIKSKHVTNTSVLQPALLFPLALFLTVPLLVGDLSYMTTTTRMIYAVTSVAVALKEEITFRALIQNLLATRFGNLLAIFLTTILFTAYHIGVIPQSLFAYGQVIFASLLLGIVYVRIRNLWLVVWLHTMYDALWSATPVFSPPLPYSVGLGVLFASVLLVACWGR